MLLRLATSDDILGIVALERLPESARFVGQWSKERHRAAFAGNDARYFVCDASSFSPEVSELEIDGGVKLRAFGILRGLAETSGSIELKRLVVHPPGRGFGRQILTELLHIAFDDFHAHRFFLDVFEDNARARHLYRSLGFVEEGVMREAALRNGEYCSLCLMSMLDREWRDRNGTTRKS